MGLKLAYIEAVNGYDLPFSYAKNHLSEIFRRVAGSTRIFRIRNQRYDDDVAIISAKELDGLLMENRILSDPKMRKQLDEFEKARREGKLVKYVPRSLR